MKKRLVLAAGVSLVAVVSAITLSTPSSSADGGRHEWVRLDGTVDMQKAPDVVPVLDCEGKVVGTMINPLSPDTPATVPASVSGKCTFQPMIGAPGPRPAP